MTDEEYSAYVSNAMDKSKITGLPIVRQDSFIAPAYKKPEESSALPAIGGIVGGILGGFLLKNPVAITAGTSMGRTVIHWNGSRHGRGAANHGRPVFR